MCIKNKIIAASLCAMVAVIGIAGIGTGVTSAQSSAGSTGATMTIEQLQQIVLNLQNQIAQILQMLAQKKTTTCAQAGETITSGGKKCCDGLTATAPAGCSATAGCVADSWVCQKPQTQTCADICKGQGYANSQCNTYAISPQGFANMCAAGYVKSNASASDCTVATDVVGAGKACCCQGQKKCAAEGQSIMAPASPASMNLPTTCCSGLTPYMGGGSESVQNGACVKSQYALMPASFLCVKCGDGICNSAAGENVCNCPQDCGRPQSICGKTNLSNSDSASCTAAGGTLSCSDVPCLSGAQSGCTAASCTCNCGGTSLTCGQACQAKGYPSSYCNAWGVYLNSQPGSCKAGELNLGWTSDCTAAGISGGGRACCCATETPPSVCAAIGQTCQPATNSFIGSNGNQCCAGSTCLQNTTTGAWSCVSANASCAAEGQTIPAVWATAPTPDVISGKGSITNTSISSNPTTCCAGLTPYGGANYSVQNGICVRNAYTVMDASYRCIKCGDGICNSAAGEDVCSCPQDCAKTPNCITEGEPYYAGQTCCDGLVAGFSNGCTSSGCPQFCQKPTCSASLTGDACTKAGGQMICGAYTTSCIAPTALNTSNTSNTSGSSAGSSASCGGGGSTGCYCQCSGTPVVGGNCAYKNYPGQCTITAVTPDNSGSASVNYTFKPTGTVDLTGTFLQSSGSAQINPYQGSTAASYLGLTCLKGPYDPTPSQVSACGVVTGAVFPCSLSVETGGTCTPINVIFTGALQTAPVPTSGATVKIGALPFSLDSISASLGQIISQLNALLAGK